MNKVRIFILLVIFLGTQAHGADSDYAYYGMGGMIQTGCMGAVKTVLHLDKDEQRWPRRLGCLFATSAIVGFTAARDESVKKGNAFTYGVLGGVTSVAFSFAFDF